MMSSYRGWKKVISLSAAGCLLLTGTAGLCGCTKEAGTDDQKSGQTEQSPSDEADQAMGRYLESDIGVPEGCQEITDLQCQDDGTLKMIARGSDGFKHIYSSSDHGESWEEGAVVAALFGSDCPEGQTDPFYNISLGRDGSILAGEYVDDGSSSGSMDYYYCTADGQGKKLDLSQVTDGFAFQTQIGANGNLFLQIVGDGVKEIDPRDGTLVHEYEKGAYLEYMGVTSRYLIVFTGGKVHYYDIEDGKPVNGGEPLTEQISQDRSNLEQGNSSSTSVLFMDDDGNDGLFYADKSGLYHFTFGGNIVEQVIDGSLCSLSSADANMGFRCMTRDKDGNFYVGVADYSGGDSTGKILCYTYSADTPTVPDTELTIYALEDNSDIRQAIVMFQKKYPDVCLTLETGMSGNDGVTRTDALKTLNTEIMAGKGPDILILDGISSDSYVEQGMLEDLSGILKDAGILPNIQDAFTETDGSIYTMPVKFAVPMLAGKKEDTEQIQDLSSMADVVESHEAEYAVSESGGYKLPFLYAISPQAFLEQQADGNSAGWIKEDGTLDETQIKEFLEQTGRMYQAAQACVEQLKTLYGDAFNDDALPSYERSYGISAEIMSLLSEMETFGADAVFSPFDFASVYSAALQDESLSYCLWNGQTADCFIPVDKVAVSAGASEKETAEEFIRFLFSGEGQLVSRNDGLPVVSSVYEGEEYWNLGEEGECLSVSGSTNALTGQEISFEIKVPSASAVQEFRELGKTLTVPIADNVIVTNAVADAGVRYLKGETDLDTAVDAVMQQVNLYLSE